jgi:hypothetical protein
MNEQRTGNNEAGQVEPSKKIIPGEKARQFSKKREERPLWQFYGASTDDDCDEDDIDLPANFHLKDKINSLNTSCESMSLSNGRYLEILKLNGDEIIDIRHLDENERFFITDDMNKRFCLAEYTGADDARFYFREDSQDIWRPRTGLLLHLKSF